MNRAGPIALILMGTGTVALAQWNLSATESLSHVDNVNRAAPGLEQSDVEQTTALNANLILHQARHQVALNLGAAHHSFRTRTDADNTSGNGALAWNWSTVEGISGQLSATRARSRYLYSGGLDTANSAEQNTRGLAGQVRLNWGGPWNLALNAQESHGWYSLPELRAQAADQQGQTLTLGRRLDTPGSVQWTLSRSASRSPHVLQSGVVPEAEINNTQFSVMLSPSPRTSGSLSVGRSRSRQNTSTNNGTSTVGSVALNWQPSAKTSLNLGWQRDIGTQRSALDILQSIDPKDPTKVKLIETGIVNESLQRTASAALRWIPSERTSLSLSVNRAWVGSTTLMDDVGVIRLGATRTQTHTLGWSQSVGRQWQLSCSHTRTEVKVLTEGDNHPLRVQTTLCSLALSWR